MLISVIGMEGVVDIVHLLCVDLCTLLVCFIAHLKPYLRFPFQPNLQEWGCFKVKSYALMTPMI